ncbi:hypothetical protein ACIQXD_01345 [Streptomyces uncialis]|uniref:hypothetical protein n=1 Tax=Streptomyces uncialis TaxID=1048205 RepID=UPI003806874E
MTLLFDELDTQRAAQAYLWSLPLIDFVTWRDRAAETFGVSGPADFVVCETLREKRGIVTAHSPRRTSSTSPVWRTGRF